MFNLVVCWVLTGSQISKSHPKDLNYRLNNGSRLTTTVYNSALSELIFCSQKKTRRKTWSTLFLFYRFMFVSDTCTSSSWLYSRTFPIEFYFNWTSPPYIPTANAHVSWRVGGLVFKMIPHLSDSVRSKYYVTSSPKQSQKCCQNQSPLYHSIVFFFSDIRQCYRGRVNSILWIYSRATFREEKHFKLKKNYIFRCGNLFIN